MGPLATVAVFAVVAACERGGTEAGRPASAIGNGDAPMPSTTAFAPGTASMPAVDAAPPPVAGDASAGDASVLDAADGSSPSANSGRVHARTRLTPIRPKPDMKAEALGFFAYGGSLALASPDPVGPCGEKRKDGSTPRFYAVEPKGFVCVDGVDATLDGTDPVVLALRRLGPKPGAYPFDYGVSKDLTFRRSLDGVDDPKWPPSLQDWHDGVAKGNTVAWSEEVTSKGKSWLRTSAMAWVDKRDVTPFPKTEFHGVVLGADHALPLAFVRGTPRPKFRRSDAGKFEETKDTWDRHVAVDLTGEKVTVGRRTFWATKESGTWLSSNDATVLEGPSPRPAFTLPVDDRASWIEVATLKGWLLAYEGDKPVFATLISAGKLGASEKRPDAGQPPATTPLGTFPIESKYVTTNLVTPGDDGKEDIHAEVQYSQRFVTIYLLHAAYWHDLWGEGRSGGCVNLSPRDSEWLFGWTSPKVPPGWYAVRRADAKDPATIVVLHR
ncbi:MAG: L,D-transpeptidase [Polyangiaceae bacterium]